MANSELTINTEEEAFALIESYLSGYKLPEHISFDGWPSLSFRLEGENFQQSITPSVMKGFIEMQSQINKSYALAKYGVPDPRKLTKEEREDLEIKVKVEKGSSVFNVDIDGFLTKLGQELIGKMSPQEIMATLLGAALIWGGVSIFRRFLDNRKEVRLAELSKDGDKEHLRTMQSMSQEETKRMELMTKFINKTPLLDNMDRMSYDAKTEMVKSFARADVAEIDGVTLDAELAKELITNARRRSTEMRIDGIYRIEEVNNTDPEAFKVKVRNIKTNQKLTCLVQDVFLDETGNKDALVRAEWERSPVHLSINAKHVDGEIKSAIILYVRDAEEKPE
ncbi:hypothetical protein [Serratia proteamaculans]|uniref:hypothetical protein n=1 Tax=Serratia proteamaculans TaxID=28151 RepID=UPI002179E4DE|nr:hypothetical protein [Serratia proteamaculans]CAI0986637.1 Uncharacterised protein [Serratia proteamaculans]